MDFFIGFISGFALCVSIVIVGALFKQVIDGKYDKESDGVDDVLDELFKTVKEQPKHYYDEERQEDFKRKYTEE